MPQTPPTQIWPVAHAPRRTCVHALHRPHDHTPRRLRALAPRPLTSDLPLPACWRRLASCSQIARHARARSSEPSPVTATLGEDWCLRPSANGRSACRPSRRARLAARQGEDRERRGRSSFARFRVRFHACAVSEVTRWTRPGEATVGASASTTRRVANEPTRQMRNVSSPRTGRTVRRGLASRAEPESTRSEAHR